MASPLSEKVSLGWNDFQTNINSTIQANLHSNDFSDVTLVSADGQHPAHRLVLSAGSPLLAKVLTSLPAKHPVLYFWDLQASLLSALVEFLYKGQVEVATFDLAAFLNLAEKMKVRGLAGSVLKEEQGENEGAEVERSRKLKEKEQASVDRCQEISSQLKESSLDQHFEVISKEQNHLNREPTNNLTENLVRETLDNSTTIESSAKDNRKSTGTSVPPLLPNKPVGKKRGPKPSKLWHFFKRSPSDLLVVVCNKCNKKVRRAKAGSDLSKACNSGMVTHLKSAHPEDVLLLKRLREGAKAPPTESEVVEPKKEPGKERIRGQFYGKLWAKIRS